MTTADELLRLAERVEQGSGEDMHLRTDIWKALPREHWLDRDILTSLDAVEALRLRLLPGSFLIVQHETPTQWRVALHVEGVRWEQVTAHRSPRPPRRLVARRGWEGDEPMSIKADNYPFGPDDSPVVPPEKWAAALASFRAQARAEGVRAGIERAAEWHEDQAQQLRHEADETMGVGRSPDFQRLNLAERHTADAQALRFLKVEGE